MNLKGIVGGLVGLVALASGCTNARYVMRNGETGIVAIPENTSSWPSYNRQKAEDLMRLQFPDGFVVENEQEVVVGETVHTNRQTLGQGFRTGRRGGVIVGTGVTMSDVQPKTEWRITYRRRLPTESMVQKAPVKATGEVQQVGHAGSPKQPTGAVRAANFTQPDNAPNAVVPANGTGVVPAR